MRPTFPLPGDEEEDDDDANDLINAVVGEAMPNIGNSSSTEEGGSNTNPQPTVAAPDTSTAVTRYLIKHLPKQLTQLRNQKHELEDKIHDLEQVVSEQRSQMAEYERRAELEKSRSKKLEDSLNQVRIFVILILHNMLFVYNSCKNTHKLNPWKNI